MKNNWKKSNTLPIILTVILLILLCIVAVITNAIGFFNIPASFLGAALGAVITALVTLFLLNGQTNTEERKERNVRIFELKKEVYTKYINMVWDIWADQHIDEKEFESLCSNYYKDIAIYLEDEKKRKDFVDYLINIGECLGKEADENYNVIKENVFNIIDILVGDLELGGKVDKVQYDRLAKTLFPGFFNKAISTEIHKVLQTKHSCFLKGQDEVIYSRNGYKYLCFHIDTMKTTGNNSARIAIGPFSTDETGNGIIAFAFYTEIDIDAWSPNGWNYEEDPSKIFSYKYKSSGDGRRLIEFDGKGKNTCEISVSSPIDEDDTNKKEYRINFFKKEELEKNYLTNYQEVARTLAERVGKLMDQKAIILKDTELKGKDFKVTIVEFLQHMKLIY